MTRLGMRPSCIQRKDMWLFPHDTGIYNKPVDRNIQLIIFDDGDREFERYNFHAKLSPADFDSFGFGAMKPSERQRQESIVTDALAEVPPVSVTSALSPHFDPCEIIKDELDLRPVQEEGKLAFLLHNVFTPEECEALIKISEDTGYSAALVDIGGGRQVLMKGYRDSSRVIIDDHEFVRCLLTRISPFLPQPFKGESLVEINERLRFLRYDPGDKFEAHCDGVFVRDENSETLITLQMYLNEGFEGGETTFLNLKTGNRVPVVPETGMVLVFEHNIMHEGSLLKSGRKYTIRTDVLYTTEST